MFYRAYRLFWLILGVLLVYTKGWYVWNSESSMLRVREIGVLQWCLTFVNIL